MASGPKHYKEAERIAERVERGEYPAEAAMLAQVHATLALAAATAYAAVRDWMGDEARDGSGWTEATR